MNTLLQDLRYGFRMLLKQKGVTAVALLSLALGIGANTALFSIVDAMLLKMLPVKEPERLVLFKSLAPREFSGGTSVLGKEINLNNVAFTVVGISAKGFDGTMGVGTTQDVSIPIAMEPQLYADKQRSNQNGAGVWWLRIMGRLKPGATAAQA